MTLTGQFVNSLLEMQSEAHETEASVRSRRHASKLVRCFWPMQDLIRAVYMSDLCKRAEDGVGK